MRKLSINEVAVVSGGMTRDERSAVQGVVFAAETIAISQALIGDEPGAIASGLAALGGELALYFF